MKKEFLVTIQVYETIEQIVECDEDLDESQIIELGIQKATEEQPLVNWQVDSEVEPYVRKI